MPQILIDTATETPTMLRRCAQFLIDLARDDSPGEDSPPARTTRVDTVSPLPEGPLAPDDPAEIFAGNMPPPPPAAAEFPGTAAPPAPATAEGNFDETQWDSQGTVWDGRIHSGNKSKNENGTWRKRKNLPSGLYESVMVENAPRHLSPVSLPPSGTVPVPPGPSSVQPQSGAVPVPPAPPVGAVPSPPVSPPPSSASQPSSVLPGSGPGVMTFKELMLKIGAGTQAGKYNQIMVEEACKRCGLDTLTQLVAQPMLVPMVAAMLDTISAGG